ncbi:MAG: hypothetical protein PWR04_1363, partial [Anaerophaga sp.]|nr:hypothetical protein [Anaerophaga sp.]
MLLMRMQKFKTTTGLATNMLFRPDSLIRDLNKTHGSVSQIHPN